MVKMLHFAVHRLEQNIYYVANINKTGETKENPNTETYKEPHTYIQAKTRTNTKHTHNTKNPSSEM